MSEAAHFGVEVAEHRVMRVTGEAGLVFRNAIVLEMRGGNIGGIISIKAFAVGLHDVARQAELPRLRILQVDRSTKNGRNDRQDKQCDKGEDFAAQRRSN